MKQLTKQDLINYGIKIVEDPNEECGYLITRYSRDNHSFNKSYKKINPKITATYHKYSMKTKLYYIVSFSHESKPVTHSLAKILYAWFKGDVPKGYDIDHINNNSLDNSLDNLQLLTRKENIAKREGFKNQYEAKRYVTSPEMREAFEKMLKEGE